MIFHTTTESLMYSDTTKGEMAAKVHKNADISTLNLINFSGTILYLFQDHYNFELEVVAFAVGYTSAKCRRSLCSYTVSHSVVEV